MYFDLSRPPHRDPNKYWAHNAYRNTLYCTTRKIVEALDGESNCVAHPSSWQDDYGHSRTCLWRRGATIFRSLTTSPKHSIESTISTGFLRVRHASVTFDAALPGDYVMHDFNDWTVCHGLDMHETRMYTLV